MAVDAGVASDAVTLAAAGGQLTATYLPKLGMVCSSLAFGGEELLAQRGGPAAYAQKGSTFALPILHPWANRLRGWEYQFAGRHVTLSEDTPLLHIDEDTGLPIHGVLAACPDWEVTSVNASELTATLDYGADPQRLAVFPFPHTLTYQASLSDSELTVALTLTAGDELPVPVCFGFHPYFAPGGDRREWQLQGPVPGLDGPLGDRVFDDGYSGLAGASFSVTSARWVLGVRFLEGYSVTQIYAPAQYELICFEPMTAPTDALRTGEGLISVAPGESYMARFSLTVAPR